MAGMQFDRESDQLGLSVRSNARSTTQLLQ